MCYKGKTVKIFCVFVLIFSALSVILTVYDKFSARKGNMYRIPEKVLLGVAVFGGAAAQYIVMKIIRHKTCHRKFMLGLPAIIIFHIFIIIAINHFNI